MEVICDWEDSPETDKLDDGWYEKSRGHRLSAACGGLPGSAACDMIAVEAAIIMGLGLGLCRQERTTG
jgi:hypothetical protein